MMLMLSKMGGGLEDRRVTQFLKGLNPELRVEGPTFVTRIVFLPWSLLFQPWSKKKLGYE
jgi:hypothetical protein